MAWDDTKTDGVSTLPASEYNTMTSYIKSVIVSSGNVDASVISGTLNSSTIIPNLDMSKITTGSLSTSRLSGNVTNTFSYTIPTTSGSYYGNIISLTAGDNLSLGDIGYYKSDGKVWKADADAESTMKGLLLMSTGTITSDTSGTFLTQGLIGNSSWTLGVGNELYVDTTTAGLATSTKPSGTSDIVRVIGYSLNTSTIMFNPSNIYIELT